MSRIAVLALALVTAACAHARSSDPAAARPAAATVPAFTFAADTFAFANAIGARHPDADDLYAHYCFVLARAVRQFHQFPRFWTLVHWTNWRVTMPVPDGHQAAVLDEVLDELATGRLVQLLVTNWPTPELNHTVVE